MTKEDLIRLLEPFTDDIKIKVISAPHGIILDAKAEYSVLVDGEGIILIDAIRK